jgi:hypothetical protein
MQKLITISRRNGVAWSGLSIVMAKGNFVIEITKYMGSDRQMVNDGSQSNLNTVEQHRRSIMKSVL